MSRKLIKTISIFLLLITVFVNFSFADSFINPDDYKPSSPSVQEYDSIGSKAGVILGYIQIIGVVLSVVILIILGIKYMLGSVEEKANYKQSLKPYLIGVFILFTGTLLPGLIYDLVNNLN